MVSPLEMILWVNIVSFMIYGFSCLLSSKMKIEFDRYKTPALRIPTGVLQILGAAVMYLGLTSPKLTIIVSIFFVLMMAIAIIIRIRIKDSILKMLPALVYLILNGFIISKVLDNQALSHRQIADTCLAAKTEPLDSVGKQSVPGVNCDGDVFIYNLKTGRVRKPNATWIAQSIDQMITWYGEYFLDNEVVEPQDSDL